MRYAIAIERAESNYSACVPDLPGCVAIGFFDADSDGRSRRSRSCSKGVGEAGAIPGPAVLAEAIEDALRPLRVRIREMPLSPNQIRELGRASAAIR